MTSRTADMLMTSPFIPATSLLRYDWHILTKPMRSVCLGSVPSVLRPKLSSAGPHFSSSTYFTMTAIITVPATYGFVVLGAGVGPFITNMYLSGAVMTARKKYKIPYPNSYAVPGCESRIRLRSYHTPCHFTSLCSI